MIPVKLSINNFLSHDKSEVDFERFNVALILGSFNSNSDQSNGAGKSAIFEAILWSLFGKSRHKKKDGVVKNDKKICKAELIFDVDGTRYRVTRMRDKIVGETDVVFEQNTGKDWKNISCDTNTATDDKICSVINLSYEVFLNSVYFKQNDISLFAESRPSERKDILKAVLKMDKWDEYQKVAREHARIISAKIQDKNKSIVSLLDIDNRVSECNNEIATLKTTLVSLNKKYEEVHRCLSNKQSVLNGLSNDITNTPDILKRVQREYVDTKKRLSSISQKIQQNNMDIEENNKTISALQQKYKSLTEKIKAGAGINMSEINNKLLGGKTKERVLKEHIAHLEQNISLDKECPTCKRGLTKDDIKYIGENKNKELASIRAQHSEVKAKLVRAEQRAKELEQLYSEATKAELDRSKLEVKVARCKSIVDSMTQETSLLVQEKNMLSKRDFEEEIKALKQKLDKDEYERINTEVKNMSFELDEIKSSLAQNNMSLGSKSSNLEKLLKQKQEQQELQDEITKLNNDFAIYDKLRHYFGKDGIQAVILENVIEELEMYANNVLSKICNEPTTVSIKTQKQGENGAWVETFEIEVASAGRTDEFETFSGGEQFRVSLALRLALSKILSQRIGGNIRFLLLDEVSSSLDDKGLEMFINIVKHLGNEMKVLVITHDEKLKEQFDDVIVVNKSIEGSRIIQ